ncbi:MAG: hypothetical protein K5866_07255 [Treponema sp.]|nr:hypothetical protein [Treponema sp.]
MNYDEDLKSILLEKGKNTFALISVFNPDVNQKNRKNSKKSRYLEEKIWDYGFSYKAFKISMPHGEFKREFLIFDNPKAGESQNISQEFLNFIQDCKSSFKSFTISKDLDLNEYLKDKSFYHPIIKEEKNTCLKRKEVILENLFEPPSTLGQFVIRLARSENSFLYENGSKLCSVTKLEDGRWARVYGTIRPVAAIIKKEYFNTREEALNLL